MKIGYDNGVTVSIDCIAVEKRIPRNMYESAHDAIQLGLYASTDISDSINMINNDNLDSILTDREAMVAVSQVMIAGMNAFRDMKAHVESRMKNG